MTRATAKQLLQRLCTAGRIAGRRLGRNTCCRPRCTAEQAEQISITHASDRGSTAVGGAAGE